MMGNLINLKVQKVIQQTQDVVTLQFKNPLLKKIDYKPGQFLTLIIKIGDQEHRRAYSLNTLCNHDKNMEVTIKKVEGGLVSNYIFNNIKAGDKVKALKPLGNFIYEYNPNNKSILLVGGGSGITPLMAILKSILFKQQDTKVYMLFANQDEHNIIFRSLLEEYKSAFPDRFILLHLLAKKNGYKPAIEGILNSELFGTMVDQQGFEIADVNEVYMCGPEGFMNAAKGSLTDYGIKEEIIFTEKFTVDQSKLKKSGIEKPSTVLVKTQGKSELQYVHIEPKQSLLEALIKAKYNIAYSCGSGICGSCKCKLVKGEITMGMTLGLTEEEKSNQIILPCVSYPKDSTVTLELI